MRTAAIAIVALLVMAACSPGPTAAPSASVAASAGPSDGVPTGDVRVVLGIYSGRPDPEWTLSADQAAALDRLIAALPERLAVAPTGGLGYHGFTVTRPGSTFTAYLGVVAPPGDGPRSIKSDPTRLVERFLLETGRPHLTGAELGEVVRALGAIP